MMKWLRGRDRGEIRARPVPASWHEQAERWLLFEYLDPDEQARLLDIVKVLLAEKNWEGCGGLELDELMCVAIAVQMALLILEIPHDYFSGVPSILVYPSDYVVPAGVHLGDGIYTAGDVRSGEAAYRGPVVLAWDRVEEDLNHDDAPTNLVLHEFSHCLDMSSGVLNGTPPLERRVDAKRWAHVMASSYERLQEEDNEGQDSVIDPYGATNECEFFAVATESFFIYHVDLRDEDPDLYSVLSAYYRQDPAARYERRVSTESSG